MPRAVGSSVENNFKGGHITEASGLNFPENACTEAENCNFTLKGNVNRRLGFDFIQGYVTKTIQRANCALSDFLWRDVSGDGATNLFVLQVGSTLHFWEEKTNTTLSGGIVTDTVDLTTFSPVGAPAPNVNECQFTQGKGYLFVTHPHLNSFSIAYNTTTHAITTSVITLEYRDFDGVNDGLAIDTRPTATLAGMTQTHYYNLLNQGWSVANLTAWDSAFTTMPSNSDVMWAFKNSSDAFDTATVANTYRGNSPAPKGHYVLNVYSQQRDTVSGLTITDITTGYQRAATCAFFAGRVFYGGIASPGFGSKIFFSQIQEGTNSTSQFGMCYQLNDPTSEDASALLASDGGVIEIPEMGALVKLIAVPGAMLAFASNGIWSISGSTGIGFTADDYTVQKISTVNALSASSFVEAEGNVLWWNADGIWAVSQGQGGLSIVSLTMSKNQTYVDTIPLMVKQKVRGAYDPLSRVIQWLYREEEVGGITELYEFTHIMNYNTTTQAFSNWSFDPDSDVSIHAVFQFGGTGGQIIADNVIDANTNNVMTLAGEQVVTYSLDATSASSRPRFLVSYPFTTSFKFTFAEESDWDFVDWASYGTSSDYTSYFISGYRIHSDAQRNFQSNYIFVYSDSRYTGLNSYYLQGLWNFANSGNGGQWTSRQLGQASDTNVDITVKRFKIRGSGKAVQFKFTSLPGEPFDIVGWSTWETGNAGI